MKKLLTMIIIISLAAGCSSEEIRPLKKRIVDGKWDGPVDPGTPTPKGKD